MSWNFLRYKIHQNWNGIEKHGEENIMELEELKNIDGVELVVPPIIYKIKIYVPEYKINKEIYMLN